jgi:hypothetical protein
MYAAKEASPSPTLKITQLELKLNPMPNHLGQKEKKKETPPKSTFSLSRLY